MNIELEKTIKINLRYYEVSKVCSICGFLKVTDLCNNPCDFEYARRDIVLEGAVE